MQSGGRRAKGHGNTRPDGDKGQAEGEADPTGHDGVIRSAVECHGADAAPTGVEL